MVHNLENLLFLPTMKSYIKFCLIFTLCFIPIIMHASDENDGLEEQIAIAADDKRKVDLLHKLFDSYFTNADDEFKKEKREVAEQTELDALELSLKLNYEKGEYIAYKNLAAFYKYFGVNKFRIKYEIKYQQYRKKLNDILAQEEKELAEQRQREKIEAIRREKERKEAEIRELEKDKDANKALIEAKKKELASANSMLTESISKIEENQEQITTILDSIQSQALLNEKLSLENKILEDEKKYIALSEEAARSQNMLFMVLGILGVLLALFFIVMALIMRRTQTKLKEKNLLIEKEKARSDELLLNILPVELAAELKENGFAKAQSFENVTVFFSDFKDFTRISEQLSPSELVEELDYCFKAFDKIIEKYDIEKIKTVGDAYICASGLSHDKNNTPHEIIKAALEVRDFVADRIAKRKAENKEFFEIRIGVHTGPIVAGIVGFKKFAYDIWGDTVNTAARMEQHSEAGKVNVSAETFELIKSEFSFTYRGKIEAKNKGAIDMYFINEEV